MTKNRYSVILFDISGVLIKLGGMPDFVRWTGMSTEEIKTRFLHSASVSEFERGGIEYSEFYDQFVKEWGIGLSFDALQNALQSWVSESYPGAGELLDMIKADNTLACLTNTNEVQWPVVASVLNVDTRFEHQYVSHLMGMVKPDVDIFEYVLDDLKVQADQILFMDDSELNVMQARNLGYDAHLVSGIDSTIELLKSKKILD